MSKIRLAFGVTVKAITPDGAKVLVANDSNSIYVIDIASSVVISVAVGGASSGIAISRDGRRAYATAESTSQNWQSAHVASFSKIPPPPPPPSSGGSGGGGSRNCFIATAACGSWLDTHVMSLRFFRDQHLLTNTAGTWFVEFYYRHSPPPADYIRQHESLRAMVRALLALVVYAIEYPLAAGLTLWLLLLLSARCRVIRRQAKRGSRLPDVSQL